MVVPLWLGYTLKRDTTQEGSELYLFKSSEGSFTLSYISNSKCCLIQKNFQTQAIVCLEHNTAQSI